MPLTLPSLLAPSDHHIFLASTSNIHSVLNYFSAMSRPASESLGACKRTRTASSCADSVEPICARQELSSLPTPRGQPAAATQNFLKRSLSNVPPHSPPTRHRKRGRIITDPANVPHLHHVLPSYNFTPHYQTHPLPPNLPNQYLSHHRTDTADRIAQLHQCPSHHFTPALRRRYNHTSAQPSHASFPIPHPSATLPIPRDRNQSLSHPPASTRPRSDHTRDHVDSHIRYNLLPPSALAVDPPPSSRRLPVAKSVRLPMKRDRGRDLPQPTTQSHIQKQHYTLPSQDDEDGHLIYKLGEGLHPVPDFPNGRYKILSELGEGTFGKVVECWDRREAQRVAIKVVRSVDKYRDAARLEIDVLLHLNMHDPQGLYHCVKLHSWFDYKSHVCMVFEKLGPSLYEQLRRNRFRPFPLGQVREYAFQLLESVNFVHSLTLIHTDLKPENILLIDSRHSNAIKLIDFGSATFESQHHSAVISTRHYRAPEVILGLGWTYPCDLWSIGCILVELYTGQALFQTHENLEHLAMMSGVLGPIPESMIRKAHGSGQKYFSRLKGGRRALNWPGGASSKASIRSVRRVQSLERIIRGPEGHSSFFDLVRSLLAFDPDTRCTSAEALRHPFFRESPHESDPPLTTPTLSSGSSACGSHAISRVQRRKTRRKPAGIHRSDPLLDATRPTDAVARIEDEGEETASEIPAVPVPSNHSIVAAAIPTQRRPANVDVS